MPVTTVTFPDADPETDSSIPANEVSLAINAKVRVGSSPATLTWIAADDLKNLNNDVIPIGNVTWTKTGAGFLAGTLTKTGGTAAPVGSWTASGSYDGTIIPVLANSWLYKAGSYSATSTLTLSAP